MSGYCFLSRKNCLHCALKQSRKLQARCDLNKTAVRTIKLRLKNENNFLVTIAIVCVILAVINLPYVTNNGIYA